MIKKIAITIVTLLLLSTSAGFSYAQINSVPESVRYYLDFSDTIKTWRVRGHNSELPPAVFTIVRDITITETLDSYLDNANRRLTLTFNYQKLPRPESISWPAQELLLLREASSTSALQPLKVEAEQSSGGNSINVNITVPNGTREVQFAYSSRLNYGIRGKINHVFFTPNMSLPEPFILNSDLTVITTPQWSEGQLSFASVHPDYEYKKYVDESVTEPNGYYFQYSADTLNKYPYIWLQFGSEQVYEFTTRLRLPESNDIDQALIALPTDGAAIFIEDYSHKPISILKEYEGFQSLLFAVQPDEPREIILSGFMSKLAYENYYFNDVLRESYEKAKISEYSNADQYIQADPYIDLNHPQIQQVAKELRSDKILVSEIVETTYEYVVDKIDYNYLTYNLMQKGISLPDQTASETLNEGSGICGDYSRLLAALLRAQGIPARLVGGFVDIPGSESELPLHAWVRYKSLVPDG